MPAAHHRNPVSAVRAAELAAETTSALDADARRYMQQTGELQQKLLQGQAERRAAWASNLGALERGNVLATA